MKIIAGAVCIDYVHLNVTIPLKLSISNFMGYIKGKSALMIYDRHPDIPTERRDAIKNVFANNGEGILETPSTCEVDIKILNLGIDTYCKLENVTNPTKVRIDYMRQEEKI